MNSRANSRKSTVAGRTIRYFHSIMDAIVKGMARWQAGNDPRLKEGSVENWWQVDFC